ncbi:MAG: hypothetical protein FWG09_04535 [Synergistaceae bacterium]|nr:hypothetical protein [Synergistaceae bacterium]
MIDTDLKILKSSEAKKSLTAKLNEMALERIAEQARLAEERNLKRDDPAEAVLKAYVALDKEMLKVVDEHIERVRKSSERNKELFKKMAMKKEIEKREQKRKEQFDEAADRAEAQRKFLRMKG